jgi:hypothetical protein
MEALYEITAPASHFYENASDCDKLIGTLPSSAQNTAVTQKGFWCKANNPTATITALSSLYSDSDRDLADSLILGSKPASTTTAINQAVADSARSTLNAFAKPMDIGCAYQVLSWKEASLLFGRSVADDFIAVQVTVRNLNAKEEFIVHNAMLSVDTDINGSIGRYFEGVDKIGVEAYNKAGEPLTPRGIVGNSIAAASVALSVIQPMVGMTNFSNAVAAFNGGVVPGWQKISPDSQKEQLLLIANNGFTATYNTKTVVGKSGAATFYTWFPAKPFLQGWWLQDCAKNVMSVRAPNTAAPQLGISFAAAQDVCRSTPAESWKTYRYKDWSPIADQLFRELSLAVVAGIHVLEESKQKPVVTDIQCPKDAAGNVDLSKPSNGMITCRVTGDNLNKILKLKLENAKNAADIARPEATITPTSDESAIDANFQVSDLAKAAGGTYNVFAVGKDGTETATGKNIFLNSSAPLVSAINPTSVDLAKPPTQINFTGSHLDKLTKLCFSTGSASGGQTASVTSGSATQASVPLSSLKLTEAAWNIYLGDCASQPADSNQTLSVTGTAMVTAITSISPNPAAIGVTLTIKGSNLTDTTAVIVGGVDVGKNFHIADSSTITVVVPAGAKSGSVILTGAGGSTTTKNGFQVTKSVIAKAKRQ